MLTKLQELRKALVALAGLAANALALGLVPAADVRWVMLGLSALSAIGVYVVPNKPTS